MNNNHSQKHAGSHSNTARAEAFSDAVFAIVITLLVLDLHPPQTEPGFLLFGLFRQWPAYLAYVTSYLYVAVVWLNHKAAFMHIGLMDRRLHSANLGILFTTALLPFPTAIISQTMRKGNVTDQRTAVGFYALVGVLLCVSWLIFFHYLHRHKELVEEGVKEDFFARESTRAWAGVVLYATAGLLGIFVTPGVALIIFLGVPIFYGITSHGLREPHD